MNNLNAPPRQQGAVLVTALVMLTVMVLLGITAINLSSSAEKMTANQRNKELSLQAAESALRDGETWLVAQPAIPEALNTCASPPCNVLEVGLYSNIHLQTASWWQTYARPFSGSLLQVNTQPRYLVEQFNFVPYELSPDARSKGEGYYYYQITSRGQGGNDEATSIVQSIYTVQYK